MLSDFIITRHDRAKVRSLVASLPGVAMSPLDSARAGVPMFPTVPSYVRSSSGEKPTRASWSSVVELGELTLSAVIGRRVMPATLDVWHA